MNTGSGEQARVVDSGGTAIDYVTLTGAGAGGNPNVSVGGSTANSNLRVASKGSGAVIFLTNGAYGNLQLSVAHTASAVNYVQVTGAATSGTPIISAQGSDASIPLQLRSKGTFNIGFANSSGNQGFVVSPTGSANYLQATSSNTTVAPSLAAAGSDTNIDLALTPKGTGNVRFGTYTANMALVVQGYIEIKDSGGTVRKLAVIA
jgi:hypothetical protein